MASTSNQSASDAIKKIKAYASGALSTARYEHSLRTAKLCRQLCERFSLDGDLGFLAGLSHDLCKQFPEEDIIALAKKDGFPITGIEAQRPTLLHGRAAAQLMQELFGIEDMNVIDAVRWHTFGRKGLCPLGKVVFVADKLEPGRKNVPEKMREDTLKLDLDKMIVKVIENNMKHLKKSGKAIAQETLEMLEELREGQ